MCFLATSKSSLEKCPFKSCASVWGFFFALEVHKLFVCFGGKFLMDVFSANISYILRVVFLLSLWFPLLCHFF